jgi:hypothetical protein
MKFLAAKLIKISFTQLTESCRGLEKRSSLFHLRISHDRELKRPRRGAVTNMLAVWNVLSETAPHLVVWELSKNEEEWGEEWNEEQQTFICLCLACISLSIHCDSQNFVVGSFKSFLNWIFIMSFGFNAW